MKANELMIGDWVFHFGKPSKVLGVKDIHKGHDAILLFGDNGFSRKGFEPIPLTEEILKANANPHIKYENICGYLSINIRKEGLKDKDAKGHFPIRIVILDGKVIFVHQLQHALRLCGLNELADNFKV